MSSSKVPTSKKRKPSLTSSGPVVGKNGSSSSSSGINSSSSSITGSKSNTNTTSGTSRSGSGGGGGGSSSNSSHHNRTPSSSKLSATSKAPTSNTTTGRPTQQQQQQQQQHQQQHGKKKSPVTAAAAAAAAAAAHAERDRKPKVLLHELAAQKYSLFLAESPGLGHLPPLSYYRRPRRKRQRPDMTKALVTLRVPGAPVDGSHTLHFSSEWRKPMTVEPEQLGAFYKPGGGVIEPTLHPPPDLRMGGIQGKDLNHGYLNYVEPDTTSSTSEIAEMLDETPGLEREEESAHFITYRNNLNKIMVTPYSKQKWEIEVFKEGGVIYLEVVMVDRNKGKMDRTSYWGRRFETLCVLGVEGARLDELQRGPDDPPRPSYCALYRSRLGNHNVLMGAEIDACRPPDPGRFVEIKTTRIIQAPKDEQTFKKHKTLKYWAQCYLAGVRDLVVGYRDDHGIVRDVKSWTTDALVDAVDKVKHWDKDVCLNFTDRCLSFLKDNVDEGPRYSMKFLEPFDQITLEQIASPTASTVPPGAGGGSVYSER